MGKNFPNYALLFADLAAIKECARVLRPGGFLLLQTPTEDGLIRRAGRLLYWVTDGLVHFQVKQFYQMGGGHTLCFNRRSIGGLLDRCGFELLRIDGSTYGLRILLKRFERLSLLERFPQGWRHCGYVRSRADRWRQ